MIQKLDGSPFGWGITSKQGVITLRERSFPHSLIYRGHTGVIGSKCNEMIRERRKKEKRKKKSESRWKTGRRKSQNQCKEIPVRATTRAIRSKYMTTNEDESTERGWLGWRHTSAASSKMISYLSVSSFVLFFIQAANDKPSVVDVHPFRLCCHNVAFPLSLFSTKVTTLHAALT